ncbi:MAG TPA: primosomal protein N' [Verrucomicrobiota bacterium]|nr:primosomal protein N' [Verrucomicrobiota bacterium]
MVARVTLEIALGREFDYTIPEELLPRVEVGSRVRVPFGPRQAMGCVTALLDHSPHARLRPILQVVGAQPLITPKVLALARWVAEYYCCPAEIALKSVLPEAVRREEAGWRERLCVRMTPVSGPFPKLTRRQNDVWQVIEEWRELPLQELLRLTGTTAETVRRLEDKGLIAIAPRVAERDPYANETILPSSPLTLNPEQQRALGEILAALERPNPTPRPVPGEPARVFLLHGVTGSGKTEVYLQAIAHTLGQGRGAIVLVPEISLTPQTVERFKSRFCHGPLQTLVAVLHSHLSSGERHDEWHKIRQGRARIAIGARSAVFAPIEPLGLIIVDEEHEHSYKQEETPRYHARDVAVLRAQKEGAVVVLGSATPSLESYYNARQGKYRLLELPTRVDNQRLPIVRVVDLRHEVRRERGSPILSPLLREAILQRLERREQVILFLNRRGYANALQCPRCGHVVGCPNCSVALTYHRTNHRLCCHLCGHWENPPNACPQRECRSPAIRYAGIGTQRVEEALRRQFPQARIQRMDSDILQRKEDYRRILGDFRTGRIDLLIGTQMIAKGLHFPNVTLVGIVLADMSLHIPDFRAAERTFQLLTQVAGRAGRGDIEGEVIVQSFTPFHSAIQYARRHDFISFYEQEIEFRRELSYPPLARAALLTLRGRNEDKVRFTTDHLHGLLTEAFHDETDYILGKPAPAPLLRAEGFYRYQILLRTRQMLRTSRRLAAIHHRLNLPEGVTLAIDVDPVNLA